MDTTGIEYPELAGFQKRFENSWEFLGKEFLFPFNYFQTGEEKFW